ncbi:nuclear transport factor 2 family protein [Microbulbifer epialgicus]|uniref:Nuclear transport factor 2 family protein n=1 Tax=Microbulbifer epialgicus TaxID=393907 RepID=A0ABV4P6G3_9GAMM
MHIQLASKVQKAEVKLMEAKLKSDVHILSEILADDLILTNHLGVRLTKRDDLMLYESGRLNIKAMNYSEYEMQIFGGAAVVVARVQIDGYYDGEPTGGDFRFTRL